VFDLNACKLDRDYLQETGVLRLAETERLVRLLPEFMSELADCKYTRGSLTWPAPDSISTDDIDFHTSLGIFRGHLAILISF
jgi:hypothetical protein